MVVRFIFALALLLAAYGPHNAHAQTLEDSGLPKATSMSSKPRYFLSKSDLEVLYCMHEGLSSLGTPSQVLNSYGTWLEEKSKIFASAVDTAFNNCSIDWERTIFSNRSLVHFFLRGVALANFRSGDPHRKEAVFAMEMRSKHLDDFFEEYWGESSIDEEIFTGELQILVNTIAQDNVPLVYRPFLADYVMARAYFKGDYATIERMIELGALSYSACKGKHQPTADISLPCFLPYVLFTKLKDEKIVRLLLRDPKGIVVMISRDHLMDNLGYRDGHKADYINRVLGYKCLFDKVVAPSMATILREMKQYGIPIDDVLFRLHGGLQVPFDGLDLNGGSVFAGYFRPLSEVPSAELTAFYQFFLVHGGQNETYSHYVNEAYYRKIENFTETIITGVQTEIGNPGGMQSYFNSPGFKFSKDREIQGISERIAAAEPQCKSNLTNLEMLDRLIDDDEFAALFSEVWEYGKKESYQFAMMSEDEILGFFDSNPFEFWKSLAQQ